MSTYEFKKQFLMENKPVEELDDVTMSPHKLPQNANEIFSLNSSIFREVKIFEWNEPCKNHKVEFSKNCHNYEGSFISVKVYSLKLQKVVALNLREESQKLSSFIGEHRRVLIPI